MNLTDWFLRKFYVKKYVLRMMKREEKKAKKAFKSISALPREAALNLRSHHETEMEEWGEWLTEIQDDELTSLARKMDIYLDEIPFQEPIKGMNNSHYFVGRFGNQILEHDVRNILRLKIREKYPAYRKERREIIDTYIKAAGALIGLIGSVTGLVAVILK